MVRYLLQYDLYVPLNLAYWVCLSVRLSVSNKGHTKEEQIGPKL